MTQKLNLLFPVETTVRELDFRLVLAGMSCRPDRRIFIGQHHALMQILPALTGGIYLGKNVFAPFFTDQLTDYMKLKQHGFTLVHLDEEGAVFPGDEEDWERSLQSRLDVKVLRGEDYLCTWGGFQGDFYAARRPTGAEKVRVTGHPRFDLLKPDYRAYYEDEAAALERTHGNFVLVNTNLVFANHQHGMSWVFAKDEGHDNDNPIPRINAWTHATRSLTRFVELIATAARAFPRLTFVIRPHPSENHTFYETLFGDVPNVRVIHEGAVAPWLMACIAMIHDGCTTGLEAHFAETPTINFRNAENVTTTSFLPNLFGWECRDIDDVIEKLAEVMEAGLSPPPTPKVEIPERAHRLLANFEADAFEQILEVLDEAAEDRSPPCDASLREVYLRESPTTALRLAKDLVRPLFPSRHARFKAYRSRFSPLTLQGLQAPLERVQMLTGRSLEARLISPRILLLE